MRELSCPDLKVRLDSGDHPLLLDVREPWECDLASLDGIRNVPMSRIPAAVQNRQLGDPGAEIVVICHHGVRSRRVAGFLEHQGFTGVINLSGGMDAWSRQVDSAMPTY